MEREKFKLNYRTGGVVYSATILFYFLLTLVGSFVMAVISCTPFVKRIISGLYSIIVLTVAIILFGVKQDGNLSDNLSLKKFKPTYLIFIVFIMGAMFFGLGFLNAAIATLFNIATTPLVINGVWEYLAYTLVICILPAILEEIFFRGMILKSMQPLGNFFAIIISSVMFASYHCSLVQLLYQFVFGLMFGGIYLLSKSVFPCIILHFANNFLVLSLIYFNVNTQMVFNPIVIACGLVILAGICLYGFFKIKKRGQEGETVIGKKYYLITSLIGFIVCLTLIITGAIGV